MGVEVVYRSLFNLPVFPKLNIKLLLMLGIHCRNLVQIHSSKVLLSLEGVIVSSPVELFHTTGISWQTDMFSLDIAVTPGKESESYLPVNNSSVSHHTQVFQSNPLFWGRKVGIPKPLFLFFFNFNASRLPYLFISILP